jgi:hypothetical protein
MDMEAIEAMVEWDHNNHTTLDNHIILNNLTIHTHHLPLHQHQLTAQHQVNILTDIFPYE